MTEEQIKELEKKHHAECIDDASRNNLPISNSQVKRFTAQGLTLVQLYEILTQRKSIEISIDDWFELLRINGIVCQITAWQHCTRGYALIHYPTQKSIDNKLFKLNRETLLTPKGVLEVMKLV